MKSMNTRRFQMRQAPKLLRFGDPKVPVLSDSGTWDTVTLANTQRTIFRDGFSAIAPLDTNRDGRIDASDGSVAGWSIRRDLNADGVIGANETRLAQASDLRIWRDANVNGRVDSGELMSFTEANVVSINVNRAWQGRTALGNGNELIATGSYTRSDNTTRGTGALNLGVHSFYRSFSTPQNVAPSASTLPTVNGSGSVADLQVAASQSGALAATLSTYAAQTTRAGQQALLDGLIQQWTATSSMKSGREQGGDWQGIVRRQHWLTTYAPRLPRHRESGLQWRTAIVPPEWPLEAQQIEGLIKEQSRGRGFLFDSDPIVASCGSSHAK